MAFPVIRLHADGPTGRDHASTRGLVRRGPTGPRTALLPTLACARPGLLLALAGLAACDWIAGPGNDPPLATAAIPDRIVEVDDTVVVDLGRHFSDPDGDALAYTAVSSAPATAAVAVEGSLLTLAGVAAGRATITVTASDPEGLSDVQSFEATVPNRAPRLLGTVPDAEVFVNGTLAIDAAAYFEDPDGDSLEYSATSSDATRAAVALSESQVIVTGVSVGGATVTVTARDPGGLAAEQVFAVTVPNRAPGTVGAIGDRELEVDSVAVLDVAGRFTEPDGEAVAYAATSSDTTRVAVAIAGSTLSVTGVARGSATVTVTARDPHGLAAEQAFQVTVPNRGPQAADSIADIEVYAGDSARIDAAAHFADPDGDALAYAAVSSDTTRVVAVIAGGVTVAVTGVSVGSATVTVTARDPEGLTAEQSFRVTVPNRAPEPLGTIPDREVHVGDSDAVNVAAYFAEPDGEPLAYAAESSSVATAAVDVSGGVLTVVAAAVGSTTVTVTARDPHGLTAEQVFAVTVPNRAPGTVGAIGDRELEVDSVAVLDVAGRFTEPDGEAVAYAATSSDTTRVAVAIAGSTLSVTGVARGSATVTVTARDPHGLAAEQAFQVTVPNRGPQAADSIADIEVYAGDSARIDAAAHFADPDGDALAYAAVSSDTTRVVAVIAGGVTVAVTGVSVGSATVTVTARDPEGLTAEQSFRVTVPNRAPEPLGTIPDREVHVGDSDAVNVAAYFAEPDGEPLAYAAESSSAATAAVDVSGGVLTVAAAAVGSATVTVTARDPHGLTAEQVFRVTVPNREPEAVGVIGDRAVLVDQSFSVGVAAYFTDPDNDDLDYAASSSNPAVATASVSVSGARVIVTGEGAGGATITVAATDPGGLSARQRFEVVVVQSNRPPRATGTIAARTMPVGGRATVDAAAYFTDPDNDDLDYAASSSNPAVATASVSVSGTRVIVTGEGAGGATITVTATDPGGLSGTQRFRVEVMGIPPNRAPAVANGLADLHGITPGARYAAHLPDVFVDPDLDPLDWSASSSNRAVVASAIANDSVVVTAVAAGSATVTVTATDPGGLSAADAFEVEVAMPQFDMEVHFTDDVTEAHRELIRAGRDTWESALAGTELTDIPFGGSATCLGLVATEFHEVDDHVAFVHVDEIDGVKGVAAQATYCHTRSSDGTPIVSAAIFDVADIDTLAVYGRLTEVAIHEFAHGLGFHNSYWRDRGLLDDGDDPHFGGTLAVGAFDAAGGTAYTGEKVPISSPDYSHWRESVFQNEVMSPRISRSEANPLSAITLQAMADIGYVVDATVADDYDLPGSDVAGVSADAPGRVLDLRGDAVPGPVIVVDSTGRIVRVDPGRQGSDLPPAPLRTVKIDRNDRPNREPPGIWVRSPSRRDSPRR